MKRAIAIPGLGGTPDCWATSFADMLATRFSFESIALPETASTVEGYAEELMPKQSIDLLIGFSIGSAVVQEMLVRNPEVAEVTVLMAPPAGRDYPKPPPSISSLENGRGKWSATMLEMMFTPEWLAAHPDVSEFFPRVKNTVPKEQLVVQSRAIAEWNGCLEKLGTVSKPVLVLAGRYDMITPTVHAKAVANAIPDSTLHIFDAGHGFPWQCPIKTAEEILKFSK